MANLEEFRSKVRQYRSAVSYSQEELAGCLGLHPTVLSNKLRGSKQAYLTHFEIKAIIRQLAEWEAIHRREQALDLLALLDLPSTTFTADEWAKTPLNRLLAEKSATPNQLLTPNSPPPAVQAPESESSLLFLASPSLQALPNPYRGLFAFRLEDSPFFFGREAFVERLHKIVQTYPVVLVVGPSGSGKSSVVFAGLEANLPANWLTASFRPGQKPFWGLAKVLIGLLEAELSETGRLVEANKLAEALQKGEVNLAQVIERILEQHQYLLKEKSLVAHPEKQTSFLLVADQFEELFSLCQDEKEQYAFMESLLTLNEFVSSSSIKVRLILTIRADFLGYVLAYRPLADCLQESLVGLGPLNRAELVAAITRPLEKLGVTLEEGLTSRILDAVANRPGSLPLLEFTLSLLWENRRDGKLTHAAYDEAGGVEQALANRAEAIFAELSPEKQTETRRLFLRLVQPGEATEDTRRVVIRRELGEESWQLANRLATARLLVTNRSEINGEETVEIVHEALLSHWQRLKEWLAADREFKLWHERLRQSWRQWQAGEEDESSLLRGNLLLKAEEWLIQREQDLTQSEIAFIRASHLLRMKEEASRRRTRRLLGLGLGVGMTVVLLLALVAFIQGSSAIEQRNLALNSQATAISEAQSRATAQTLSEQERRQILARQLISEAKSALDGENDLAVLLSLEANRFSSGSLEARNALFETVTYTPDLLSILKGHSATVYSVAFSPDGKILASGSADGTIRVWDGTTYHPLGQPLKAHEQGVTKVAFSPDGKILASGGVDKTVRLWNTQTWQPLGPPLPGHTQEVSGLSFSPDGKTLVSGSSDSILRWDVTTQQLIGPLPASALDGLRDLSFSPDGRWLVYLSSNVGPRNSLIVWDTTNWQPITINTNSGGCDCGYRLVFSPDSKLLVFGDFLDKKIRVWDLEAKRLRYPPLAGHTGSINALAFSPDGQLIASSGIDYEIRIWSAITGQPAQPPLPGHKATVNSLAFSPDNTKLVSAGEDATLRVWQLKPQAAYLSVKDTGFGGLAIGPDGKLLAAGGSNGLIYLWNSQTGQPLSAPLQGHRGIVNTLSFSPDGKLLASGGKDATLRLWDSSSWKAVGTPLDTNRDWRANLKTIVFSPDGKFLVARNADGGFWRWDIGKDDTTKTPWFEKEDSNLDVSGLAMSPDGKTVVFGSQSYLLQSVDINSLQQANYAQGHTAYVTTVTFSPDGKQVASAGNDKTIRLWDSASRQPVGLPLSGHAGRVNQVVFSPDGKWLASASDDGSVRLWDVATRQPLGKPLLSNPNPVTNLVFSQVGTELFAATSDGAIYRWELDYQTLQQEACRLAGRNLSKAEWAEYISNSEPYHQTCSDF